MKDYVIDRISWILFFLGCLAIVNLLIFLDTKLTLSDPSLWYLNCLLILLFLLFFIWRFMKETAYLKEIERFTQEDLPDDWTVCLPQPLFRQEHTIHRVLQQAEQRFVQQIASIKEMQLLQQDSMAAWIHEVKTPLTAMKMMIDTHRNERVIQQIENEWLRIHLLIDQQLYISRLATLASDYILEDTNLHRLVVEEVRALATWCLEKDMAVEIVGTEHLALTDKKWAKFIVRQLLTNAIKYSPNGSTLMIELGQFEKSHSYIRIADEGPGISMHELPRIFDKGFTGNTGRIHNAATGLGLFLAKKVADQLKITLQVQKTSPSGTVMQVVFPTHNEFDQTRQQN